MFHFLYCNLLNFQFSQFDPSLFRKNIIKNFGLFDFSNRIFSVIFLSINTHKERIITRSSFRTRLLVFPKNIFRYSVSADSQGCVLIFNNLTVKSCLLERFLLTYSSLYITENFKHSCSICLVSVLLRSANFPSCYILVSYAFADVHLLHFGDLIIRFIYISLFVYIDYVKTISEFFRLVNVLGPEIYTKPIFSKGEYSIHAYWNYWY